MFFRYKLLGTKRSGVFKFLTSSLSVNVVEVRDLDFRLSQSSFGASESIVSLVSFTSRTTSNWVIESPL